MLGFCYLKTGGMCCPVRLLFKGIGLLTSRSPASGISEDDSLVSLSAAGVLKEKSINQLGFEVELDSGATRQLWRTGACPAADHPEPDLVSHDRRWAG